jgi:hypothetical protein
VPIISVFFGIVIRMFYREHEPAHFHAEYQGQRGTFDVNGRMIAGTLKSRIARRLIREWAMLHQRDIAANWENMKAGRALERIEPLE